MPESFRSHFEVVSRSPAAAPPNNEGAGSRTFPGVPPKCSQIEANSKPKSAFDRKKCIHQAPHFHSDRKITMFQAAHVHSDRKKSMFSTHHIHSDRKKTIHQAPQVRSDRKKSIDSASQRPNLEQRTRWRQIGAKSKPLASFPARCQSRTRYLGGACGGLSGASALVVGWVGGVLVESKAAQPAQPASLCSARRSHH